MAGEFGVRAALEGETGKMVSFVRKSDDPYGTYLWLRRCK